MRSASSPRSPSGLRPFHRTLLHPHRVNLNARVRRRSTRSVRSASVSRTYLEDFDAAALLDHAELNPRSTETSERLLWDLDDRLERARALIRPVLRARSNVLRRAFDLEPYPEGVSDRHQDHVLEVRLSKRSDDAVYRDQLAAMRRDIDAMIAVFWHDALTVLATDRVLTPEEVTACRALVDRRAHR